MKSFEEYINEARVKRELKSYPKNLTIDIHTSSDTNNLGEFSIADFKQGYGDDKAKVYELTDGDIMFETSDGEDFAIGTKV